jgi:hypothetical protein
VASEQLDVARDHNNFHTAAMGKQSLGGRWREGDFSDYINPALDVTEIILA